MIQGKWIEISVGGIVLLTALAFFAFAYTKSNIQSIQGYKIYAEFQKADGLLTGSDVRLSGVKIGQVTSIQLNPETYGALVTLEIEKSVHLPEDSSAEIIGDGLLGNKFLSLVPGGSETMLKPGSHIQYTQSALSLESIIGRFIFNSAQSGSAASSKKP